MENKGQLIFEPGFFNNVTVHSKEAVYLGAIDRKGAYFIPVGGKVGFSLDQLESLVEKLKLLQNENNP